MPLAGRMMMTSTVMSTVTHVGRKTIRRKSDKSSTDERQMNGGCSDGNVGACTL
jgi:hypothetical protein